MSKNKTLLILAITFLLFSPLAFGYSIDVGPCQTTCKSNNFSIGKCSTFASGCAHGWIHYDAGGACGLGSQCCCSSEYKDLDAAGMCTLVVYNNVDGGGLASPFTCDFPNEVVNYYNESNNLVIECKDCGTFACASLTKKTIISNPGPKYKIVIDGTTSACDDSETVAQGNSDIWGYDYTPNALCGNHVVDSGEDCDGTNLNGKTCLTLSGGFTGGTLACSADCKFDTTSCTGGSNTVPPTVPPTNKCQPGSPPTCAGLTLMTCQNMGSYYDWKKAESPSLQCCDDGDCGSSKCGFAWLQGKKDTIAPLTKGGYCCGDDGDADLGTVFDTVNVCVKDGTTYQWIKGVNATRYLNKRLLYCEGNFTFCLDEAPYYQLGTPAVDCTNLCNYYCEPRFNTWLSDTAPEGLNILNESIKTGEQIDTEKFDLSGKSGCCPSTWCWNGKQCIENQIDEPLNMYTLKNANGKVNRCQDGAWMIANLSVTWDYKLKGYCPDKDKQCFVGNFSYSGNNKPETYFSDKKPQCIGDGQYILDYYCNANKWQSRTSLVATKMLALAGVENGAKFKIFCDDYSISLNDLNYQIMGKPVLNYLAKNCKLNNRTFNCVNNFCVLKDQTTGNVMLGTSLNVPFENPTNGLANVLGVSGCATPSAHGVWDYGACGANAVYNPTFGLVIFSKTGITTGSSTSSWQLFRDLIKDPIVTLSDLIIRGQIQFQSASGLMIKFNVLNTSKMFSRLYLADFGGGQKVEGIFENSRFDAVSNKPKHYLLIDYQNWNVDICRYVNNYTLALDRRLNCKKNGNNYVVLDEREAPSLLMEHWADLTSKFKP